jgi:hypothetical protein
LAKKETKNMHAIRDAIGNPVFVSTFDYTDKMLLDMLEGEFSNEDDLMIENLDTGTTMHVAKVGDRWRVLSTATPGGAGIGKVG